MARIRSIKPEFWKSEAIARLPHRARLTFIALWSYVDDNGVGRDNERLIAAELYPLEEDPREAVAIVREDLARLAEEGRVTRYTVDGRAYLYVVGWSEHQKIDKPGKPRYPGPTPPLTCDDAPPALTLATSSRESRDTLAPGTGNREKGTEEQGGEEAASAAAPRDDVERLCAYFLAAIHANGCKGSVTKAWRDEARLLLDKDGRDPHEIRAVIDWATADSFWQSNVLSVPKLRAKYDQLRLGMRNGGGRKQVGSGVASRPDDEYLDPGVFGRVAT